MVGRGCCIPNRRTSPQLLFVFRAEPPPNDAGIPKPPPHDVGPPMGRGHHPKGLAEVRRCGSGADFIMP